MKYVLIAVWFTLPMPADNPKQMLKPIAQGVTMQEFSNYETCQNANRFIQQGLLHIGSLEVTTSYMTSDCYPQ